MQPVDDGYFPRGESVLRRVHGAKAVGVLYGQRALLVQATHPLAFAGLMANTKGLDAPFQRLARTAKTMERVYFGTRAEADRVTAAVRAMHARVAGELDAPAGRHPAGAAYRADARVTNFLIRGLLPARVRDLYAIDWDPARQIAFEGLSRGLRANARVTPATLRRGSSAAEYELVARTERKRLERAAA